RIYREGIHLCFAEAAIDGGPVVASVGAAQHAACMTIAASSKPGIDCRRSSGIDRQGVSGANVEHPNVDVVPRLSAVDALENPPVWVRTSIEGARRGWVDDQ